MSRQVPLLAGDETKRLSPVGYLVLTSTAFATAVGINTASVAVEQRGGLVTRWFGSKAWYVHLAVVSPGWAWFLLLLRMLDERTAWPLPAELRPLGIPILMLAVSNWLSAFTQLGLVRTLNGAVFGRGDKRRAWGGSFRWSRNPMYDSYAIAFVGTAFRKGNAIYLLLAAESFILLNLLEAPVENRTVGEALRQGGPQDRPYRPNKCTRRPHPGALR